MSNTSEQKRLSRLLIVEDDRSQLRTLSSIMQKEGFVVVGVTTASQALESVKRESFGVAIVDLRLADLSGTQLLEKISALDGRIRVIIHTGYGSFDSAKHAVNLGAFAYVEKTGNPDELIRQVHAAARWHLDRYAEYLEEAVAERTSELSDTNAALQAEMAERERAEEELRESERLLLESQSVAQVGSYILDISTGVWKSSPILDRIFGIGEDFERSVESWLAIVHPDDRQSMADYFAHDVIGKHGCFDKEYRVVRHDDGIERWVLGRGKLEFDARGRPLSMVGTIQDITARKRAEEELRETQEFLQAVMDSLPVGIAVNSVDPSVDFEYMNDNFPKYYRTTKEALAAPDAFWDSVYEDPEFRKEIKKQVLDDCASGDPARMYWTDIPITRKGDETTFITARNTPTPDKQLMISTVWDVTERKRAEEELAKYREHLEELVEQRTRELGESREQLRLSERLASVGTLAAGIAHEVNNPVGMILLAAQNALAVKGQPEFEHLIEGCLEDIIENARRCGHITKGVLQFAKEEPALKQCCKLNPLIEHVVVVTRKYVQEHDAVVEVRLAEGLPEVEADPVAMEQVFVNLIRNAVDAGMGRQHVLISTEKTSDGIRIVVRDNGKGITQEHLKNIFDPFSTTRREKGGTGLGLSIVHGIITEHEGTIGVESRIGCGTAFTIDLPAGGAHR